MILRLGICQSTFRAGDTFRVCRKKQGYLLPASGCGVFFGISQETSGWQRDHEATGDSYDAAQ